MTGQIDDATKAVIDRFRAEAEKRSERGTIDAYEEAWRRVLTDDELKRARARLSIHEIRLIIRHAVEAAISGKVE